VPVNQQRLQREVNVRPPADVHMLQRRRHVEHAPGVHVQPERAQEPPEVKQVVENGAHFPTLARFSSSEIRSPRTA
jgi:hypothetical protein